MGLKDVCLQGNSLTYSQSANNAKNDLCKKLSLLNPFKSFSLIFCYALLVASCSSTVAISEQPVPAHNKPTVHFAGISYLGSMEFLRANYPQTLKLNAFDGAGVGELDAVFTEYLKKYRPEHFIIDTSLANMAEGKHFILTLAIEKELLSEESYITDRGQFNKTIADISAQALIFDYKTMTLVANIPVAQAVNSGSAGNIDALFSSVYLSNELGLGLLERAAKAISSMSINELGLRRAQVTEVVLSDHVSKHFAGIIEKESFKQHIGQHFSSALATNTRIRVLPYIRGYALGKQLPARFADGRVYTIEMPKADIDLTVMVDKWSKSSGASNRERFASIATVLISNTVTQTELLHDDFFYSVDKLNVGKQLAKDDLSAYEDSLEQLLTELSQQLRSPETKWFKSHARSKDVKNKFKPLKAYF